jgi:hypothetical protein
VHLQLQNAAVGAYGEISDRIAPGPAYVELLLEMVESSHLEMVPLTRVVCVEDGEAMSTVVTLDSSGLVRARKGKQEVKEPTDNP